MPTYDKLSKAQHFTPPAHWLTIQTIDMHTGGEPLRVITSGFPELEGNNVLEYRRYCQTHHDDIRKTLMWEPRGHADMYGCILLPPNDEGADFGVLFIHNEGYSSMCGHAVIALGRLAVEMGWVKRKSPITEVKIDAPCGRIHVFVHLENNQVQSVSFHCVPSFVAATNIEIEVPSLGKITYDLAYGGAFYAYVDIAQLGIAVSPKNYRMHIEQGMAIKRAVINSAQAVQHPFEPDLSHLYGTIFTEKITDTPGLDSRNVCIFADAEVDRCPTGSGVSGRMAIHHAKGDLKLGEAMIIESIVGSRFEGKVDRLTNYGPYPAVIPEVSGMAYITGQHTFYIDPNDPLKDGFFLR